MIEHMAQRRWSTVVSRRGVIAAGSVALTGCAALLGLDEYPATTTELTTPDASDDAASRDGQEVPVDASIPGAVRCGAVACRAHELCDMSVSANPICVCGFGYALDGGSCQFIPRPLDPGFENKPVAWTVTGAATLRPDASSLEGAGEADIGGGAVAQTFDMPSLDYAEPFAAEIVARDSVGFGQPQLTFGTGGASFELRSGAGNTTRICLGERAYGRQTSLTILGKTVGPYLDRVSYVPAPECPLPGAVIDGSFTGAQWAASGNAGVEDGLGVGSSRAGRLKSVSCSGVDAKLTGLASMPSNVAGLAVRFSHRGAPERSLTVLGASIPERSTMSSDVVCVPAWAKGYTVPLEFAIAPEQGTTCSGADSVVDDVSLVSTPTCAGPSLLFDGGFENAISYWTLYGSGKGRSSILRTGGEYTRTGVASLSLDLLDCGGQAIAFQQATAPPPDGTASGTALTYWAKRQFAFEGVKFRAMGIETTLTTAWAPYSVCLTGAQAVSVKAVVAFC